MLKNSASPIFSEIKCSMLILPIQAGQRPIIVIKDEHNSLLIIKLHSGKVTGGPVESSVDFSETFNFCAEADLFTTFSVAFVAALSLFFMTFPLKCFLFFSF